MAIQRSTFVLSLIIAVLISLGAGIALYHFVLKDMWSPKPAVNSVSVQNATTTSTVPATTTQPVALRPTTVAELFPGIKNMKLTDSILDMKTYAYGPADDYINNVTLTITPGIQIPTEKQFCELAGEGCGYDKTELSKSLNASRMYVDTLLKNTSDKIWSQIKDEQTKETYEFSSFITGLFSQRIAGPGFMIMPIIPVELSKPLENSVAFITSEGQDTNYNFQLRLVGKIGNDFYTANMYLEPYCTSEKDTSDSCKLEKRLNSCTSPDIKGCSYAEVVAGPIVQEKISKAVKKLEGILFGN